MTKNYCVVLICLCVAAVIVQAAPDNGFYIPKSFYVIDSDGHKSAISILGSQQKHALIHRLKRSAAQFSSSSSSSSSSSNGGPVFFHQTSSQSHGPNQAVSGLTVSGSTPLFTPNLASSAGQFAGGQSYAATNFGHGGGVASIGGLQERFGGDDQPQQQSFVYNSPGNSGTGHFTATSGVVHPNGQVHYSTQSGKFRK